MVDEFPGNSRRPIQQRQNLPATPKEDVQLEKVVTGKVIKRNKPLGRRIKEMFFTGDSTSVFGYLGKEVLLPAFQNLITDFVTQGIERAVFGEARTPTRTRFGSTRPTQHISYDRPSSVRPPVQPRRPITQPSAFDPGEIIFDSKVNAEVVTDKLFETIEQYGCVTVANLNELVGQTSQYTDHKYGWTDLHSMDIKRIREGWLLMLPEPEDLR